MSDGLGITARWPRLLCPAGQAFPLKVIRFAEPRHGSSFWHELRDVQAALVPTGGYKRGGNLSCRWVLDAWGKWTKQCIEFGLAATHLRKAVAPGKQACDDPERVLPEHTASSYGLVSVLCRQAGMRGTPSDKARAVGVLDAMIKAFIPGCWNLPVVLDAACSPEPQAPVAATLEVTVDEGIAFPGELLTAECALEELPGLVALRAELAVGEAISLGQLLAKAHEAKCTWLAKQLAVALGNCIEVSLGEAWAALPDSPLDEAASSSKKRKDIHIMHALSVTNPSKLGRTAEARLQKSAFAKHDAQLPTSTKMEAMTKTLLNYKDTVRSICAASPGDVSIAVDGSRVSGQDILVQVAMDPFSGKAWVAPPQVF